MKILMDAHCDGADEILQLNGYDDVEKVSEIHSSMKDVDVIAYARDHNMILVTKDKRNGGKCELAGVPCIPLPDTILYKHMLDRLTEIKVD
ncbi:MAG: hypothetical protein F4W68_00030 [Cenarchaeum sp. SB0661_bin_35]|nr:hypothetical protein [Cenarchaeum sp. SB0667_bin_13]MXZ94040.1 hypothetical protein [Cenarchaeum sp. SB0666_bin_15]MYC78892.1 hypothetical protein [Cenarchaeum sp. SB0661_bin_35]MYJ27331.1 hypothetical protein [Cenarchaeum sp. SB0672_bin_9]